MIMGEGAAYRVELLAEETLVAEFISPQKYYPKKCKVLANIFMIDGSKMVNWIKVDNNIVIFNIIC